LDRRRIEAIFLIVLHRSAGFEVEIALTLLLACGANTGHVAEHKGLCARERTFVDAERFQQSRQFIHRVGAMANESIKVCWCDAKLSGDAREFIVIKSAKLLYFTPMLDPLAEHIRELID
jgi:hypothetical protein